MAGDAPASAETPRARTALGWRIAKWLGIAVLALLVLVAVVLLGLNTSPGRRFLVSNLSGYTTAAGLKIELGGIDGSLYGQLTIRDLRISDPRGVFATAPEVDLDWRPFAYINKHVDVRSASVPLFTLARLPELKSVPSDPNAPTLPDLDIDIGSLKVAKLVLGAPVTGTRRVMTLDTSAHIADRRAQLTGHAAALDAGDRLALTLDAVPDDDKLTLNVALDAPTGGIVAGMAGLHQPLAATIGGRGSWKAWAGKARATLGGEALADLDLRANSGTFHVSGPLHPGLILPGQAARLTSPAMLVDIVTHMKYEFSLSILSFLL